MLDKHMPHTHGKVFDTKLLSFCKKLSIDVGNKLVLSQREYEKTN